MLQEPQIVNPSQWIASQLSSLHPNRPPMLYVAHPVGAQPGDIIATCTHCQASQLYARGASVDLRQICDHDAPVRQMADAAAIVAFNLARALRWWQWLRQLEDAVFSLPWCASVTVCDDTNPRAREIGMRDNREHVRRHDAVILCGPRVSSGMLDEATTCMGPVFRVAAWPNGEPPTVMHPSVVPWRRWSP